MEITHVAFLVLFILILVVYNKTLETFGAFNINNKEDSDIAIRQLKLELEECRRTKDVITRYARSVQIDDGPTKIYQNPRTEVFSNYIQVGYIHNDTERYPLYGKHKIAGRSEKWLYYVIDDSRARIKIKIESKNDNELITGDNVSALGKIFAVEIYDNQTLEYNPNVF